MMIDRNFNRQDIRSQEKPNNQRTEISELRRMVESISLELCSGRRETNSTQDIRSNRRPDGGPKC